MATRGSTTHLLTSLLAFLIFMALLLAAVAGFGVGTVELLIWLVLVVAGVVLIVRRHRTARQP